MSVFINSQLKRISVSPSSQLVILNFNVMKMLIAKII